MRIYTDDGGGSGIIYEVVGTTAYIVTNEHVIAGGAFVRVRVRDSETYEATVLGADSGRDLAVLRICCGTFQAVPFAEDLRIITGMEVLVIGYPGGAVASQATVTRGIVSAIGPHQYYDYGEVIQTDAAINPGNSGGPVFSLEGQLIGIATFKQFVHPGGRQAEALGFAIPASTVLSQLPALRSGTFTVPPTATPTLTSSDAAGSNGELRHAPSDGRIKLEWADVSFADFLVEATFINPYSGAE